MGHVRKQQQTLKTSLDLQIKDAASRVLPDEPILLALLASSLPAQKQVLNVDGALFPWLDVSHPASRLTLTLAGPVRVAVTGPNGCGKSTLLHMLTGSVAPLSGLCATYVPCAYLDQQLQLLDHERSVVEQLGMLETPLPEGELRSRLALLQLDALRATQPIKNLSGGERLKAATACAFWRATPAQLLLLDEPTNHLDLESVLAFELALADFAGALIVVSHDESFLESLQLTHRLRWSDAGWQFENLN